MKYMKLRPHHALCIQKFTGHGYDGDFTGHMTEVVKRLRDEPDTQICITFGCDELCTHCPRNAAGRCLDGDRSGAIDKAASSVLGLSGEAVEWAALAAAARARILEDPGTFRRVCGECEWFGLCADTKI